MKNRKLVSFTLSHEIIEKLNNLVKTKSINKSAFIERLINEEIEKEVKNGQ
jgi:predicted DNA-binding protein